MLTWLVYIAPQHGVWLNELGFIAFEIGQGN
jgi:hypothetical protein